MLQFDNIVDAVHGLSQEEKLKLRVLLDEELKSPASCASPLEDSAKRTKRIIGLFADEPELMDRVMESVYERRSRPLRLNES